MNNPTLGITILGSIAAILVALAIILRNGQKIHEEKEAKKREEIHKNFLKVKNTKE